MELINRILLVTAVLTSYLYIQNASAADPYVVKDRKSFPYMVAINYNKSLACNGVILDKRHVLTAAHCVNVSGKVDVNMLQVLVGGLVSNITKDTETRVYAVKSANVHRKYNINSTIDNDIAILKLNKDMLFTSKVQAISIWNKTVDDPKECIAVGWGFYNSTNKNISDVLQNTTATIQTNESCVLKFGKFPNTTFCAAVTQPICIHGAPIICQNVIRGLATSGNCSIHNFTLFTNASVYSTWINHTMKSSSSSNVSSLTFVMAMLSFIYYNFIIKN